ERGRDLRTARGRVCGLRTGGRDRLGTVGPARGDGVEEALGVGLLARVLLLGLRFGRGFDGGVALCAAHTIHPLTRGARAGWALRSPRPGKGVRPLRSPRPEARASASRRPEPRGAWGR